MVKELDRIPYDNWVISQLSVARFYDGINVNWKRYEFDREVVKQMAKDNDDRKLYKPDIVCYE